MPDLKIAFPSIKDVPVKKWEILAQKKIYFGHMSVGYNIIDGLKDIIKENRHIELNIVETTDYVDFKVPLLAHSRVGKNTDPLSKMNAFSNIMKRGVGGKADIAFLKFCYIDFMADANVEKIFNEYRETISELKQAYPEITFIHTTVPLTARQTGPKAWIKKIMGKAVWGVDDNIKKNKFNQLLRDQYRDSDPIFDIEEIESTYPDGRRKVSVRNGIIYYSMVPEYTDDGGHLNELGRKKVGEQLLIMLANLS
jgi:hypothetical protein